MIDNETISIVDAFTTSI